MNFDANYEVYFLLHDAESVQTPICTITNTSFSSRCEGASKKEGCKWQRKEQFSGNAIHHYINSVNKIAIKLLVCLHECRHVLVNRYTKPGYNSLPSLRKLCLSSFKRLTAT